MDIGSQIRSNRKAKGLSTTELAYHLNKSAQTIVAYEAGTVLPPLDVVERLADLLDVSLDQLAGREPSDG